MSMFSLLLQSHLLVLMCCLSNTHTNKTWSSISGISLKEVNKLERKILLGIDFSLHVNKTAYESWLNLLRGFGLARENNGNFWENLWSTRTLVQSDLWTLSHSAVAYTTPTQHHCARPTSLSSWPIRHPFTFASVVQPTPQSANGQLCSKSRSKCSTANTFSHISSFPLMKAPWHDMPAISLSVPVPPVNYFPAANHCTKPSHSPECFPLFKCNWTSNSQLVATTTQNTSSTGQHIPSKRLSTAWPPQEGEQIQAVPQVRTSVVQLHPSLNPPTLDVTLIGLVQQLTHLLPHPNSKSTSSQ